MHDSPLLGIPIPDSSDVADIPTHLDTIVDDMEAKTNLVFDTVISRNAALPAPLAGQECFTTADDIKWLYTGSAWAKVGSYSSSWPGPWEVPWGKIYHQVLGAATSFSASTSTLNTGSISLVADRLYRVTSAGMLGKDSSSGTAFVSIQRASANVYPGVGVIMASASEELLPFHLSYLYSPPITAGSTHRLLYGSGYGGLARVRETSYILIEDLGPE